LQFLKFLFFCEFAILRFAAIGPPPGAREAAKKGCVIFAERRDASVAALHIRAFYDNKPVL